MSTETPETSPLPPYTSTLIKAMAGIQNATDTTKTSAQNFWTSFTSANINMTMFYIGFPFILSILFLFQLSFFINSFKSRTTSTEGDHKESNRFIYLYNFFLVCIFFLLLLVEAICAFKILRVVQAYTKEKDPSNDGIFFVSRPNDSEQTRASIKDFIETAQEESPAILDYNADTFYVYINKNFENVLLATRIGKISGLQQDMDKIFTVYTYVPVAIIVNDTLISLSGKPFFQEEINSADS